MKQFIILFLIILSQITTNGQDITILDGNAKIIHDASLNTDELLKLERRNPGIPASNPFFNGCGSSAGPASTNRWNLKLDNPYGARCPEFNQFFNDPGFGGYNDLHITYNGEDQFVFDTDGNLRGNAIHSDGSRIILNETPQSTTNLGITTETFRTEVIDYDNKGIDFIPRQSCNDDIEYGIKLYRDDEDFILLEQKNKSSKKSLDPCQDLKYIYFHPENYDDPTSPNVVTSFLGTFDKRWSYVYANSLTANTISTPGGFNNPSSIKLKDEFQSVNSQTVLDKLSLLEIKECSYKHEKNIRHVGAIAEEFYELFGLGSSNELISTIDADGIMMLAIQALKKENDELKIRLEKLENK